METIKKLLFWLQVIWHFLHIYGQLYTFTRLCGIYVYCPCSVNTVTGTEFILTWSLSVGLVLSVSTSTEVFKSITEVTFALGHFIYDKNINSYFTFKMADPKESKMADV